MSHEPHLYSESERSGDTCMFCGKTLQEHTPTIATLTAQRDKLIAWRNTVGRGQGCGCNNGDGEEWCVGTCIAKAERDALRTALEAAAGMFNEMHPHTQGHMAENCTRRTDFCFVAMVVREALGGKS